MHHKILEFRFEVAFPACGHKEKLKLTSRDKRGIEEVVQIMFEKRNGLCLKCYSKSQLGE